MINLSKAKSSKFVLIIVILYSIVIHTNWNLVTNIVEQLLL